MRGVKTVYIADFVNTHAGCTSIILKLTGCLIQGVSKKLYNSIPNVTVWRVLRKRLHLKTYQLSTFNTLIDGEFVRL
jgi:hypothetical protein